jgi:peptidoglycan/LPS O-acetylase OafA/YrhL
VGEALAPQQTRMPYRADLDGLRAVAVLLVIASHAGIPVAIGGGDAGVTGFFVLSGYLITRRLLDERSETGQINLARFYGRRVIRLGPALLALIAFAAIGGFFLVLPSEWGLGVLTCLGYVSNWVQVLGHQISPLGHTWSLAIEEQFYLVWPLLMLALPRRRLIWVATFGIAIGSAVRTLAGGDFEYFSTVTRGDAILVGCLAALLAVRLPTWAGPMGIALLIAVAWVNVDHDVSIPIAMVAAALVVTSEWAALGFLASVGRRSYGLYLWNYPMQLFFGPLGIPMTFAAAELSYRLIELPISRWQTSRRHRSRFVLAGSDSREANVPSTLVVDFLNGPHHQLNTEPIVN